jgi:hypothetical protein
MTTTITLEQLDAVQQALNDLDFFVVEQDDPEAHDADAVWYPHYSGRAMYGATCLGVTVDDGGMAFMIKLGWALAKLDENNDWVNDLSEDLFDSARTDQMGRGTIVYFPQVQVEGLQREDGMDD